MTSSKLMDYWQSRKTMIEKRVEEFVKENLDWEAVDLSRYLTKDGKRFRGVLLLLVEEALGGNVERGLDAALAVELLHAASLALDDIVDQDVVRRGEKAAWVVYGNKKVILTTNYLIPTALNVISSYGEEALKISVELWRNIGLGALKDLYESSDYMKIVELKTGSFFELSTSLAAISAGKSQWLQDATEMGKILGVHYQLVDDYMDIIKLKRGNEIKLIGSASVLFRISSPEHEKYVKSELDILGNEYIRLLDKMQVKGEYREILDSIPQFFMSQLEQEELSR